MCVLVKAKQQAPHDLPPDYRTSATDTTKSSFSSVQQFYRLRHQLPGIHRTDMLPATLLVWWQSDVYARVCVWVSSDCICKSAMLPAIGSWTFGQFVERRVKLPTLINHCARTECAEISWSIQNLQAILVCPWRSTVSEYYCIIHSIYFTYSI